MKITKRSVEKLEPASKDAFYWDEEFPGFGVKVTPAGKRIFVFQSRLKGRSRRYTIGSFGRPWSTDAARAEAHRMMGLIVQGIDPAVTRATKGYTVSDLADHYWEKGAPHKKSSTAANEKGLQKRHIDPLIGKVALDDLTRQDIQQFVLAVAAGKTATDVKTKARGRARVTGGKGSANRTLGLLSSMLSFAVEEGLIPSNPATGIKQFKLKTHDRFLSQSELERLGETLVKSEQSGISPYAIAAIRFMALTGCRKNEALLLRRSWIDFERRLVKYPDSKTGQKVMRIGAAAVDLVSSLPQVAGCPLVFASAAGGEIPLSIGKIWRKLRSEADLQDLRLHDLRHNFASAAVSSGQTLHVVAKLLGHSQTHTTERYAHLSNDPIREAAEMISAAMADRLSGAKSEETPSSTPRE